MGSEVLVPLGGMAMIIVIVGAAQAGKTIRYYLDWRMRMTERQLGGRDQPLAQAVQELRAEIAALKQHEAEAVLSFDSTLQTLDARVKHLEGRALGAGGDRALNSTAAPPVEQPAQQVLKGA